MTLRDGRNGLDLLSGDPALQLLLVDGCAADRQALLAALEEQLPRAQVQVETTLRGALTRMGGHPFDLVLVDLPLPDAQGEAVLQAIRTVRPGTAIVVLPSRADHDQAMRVLAGGAEELVVTGHDDGPRLRTAVVRAVQRTRAVAQAHRYLDLARGLLDALEAPTCAVDSQSTIVAVNRAWRDFTRDNGGTDDRCGVGVRYLDVCDGAPDAAVVARGIRDVIRGSVDLFGQEYPCQAPGQDRWFRVRVTPALINGGPGAVITHLDVTGIRTIQESLAHQALHDSLTGLPNRVLLRDRLEQALGDVERHGVGVAVTHLDLARFQLVNDHLGYRGGDAVLVEVARRLQTGLRPGDTLARPSGDEFLVLWRGLPRDGHEAALRLSRDLLRVLEAPVDVDGSSVSVAASAGVSVNAPGQGVDELLGSADTALHEAKRRGPGQLVCLTEEVREATALRRSLETELRLTLHGPDPQLVLHYQPVVDLDSGSVVAVEALVRWQHPRRGLLGPDRFVPVAEATGLIHDLGDWVLDRAVRDAPYLTHGGRELDVAVNVSVRQLGDHAIEQVRRALETSGLRPSRLVLEVTETAFAEDEAATTSAVVALAGLGVQIAIDDFGTGYSTLLYVRRFPADTLKIDREFVRGLGRSADDEAICGSVTSLAAAVGASTVAEGVETMAQYAVLRSLGCVHGQGYLWSPAVPLDELPAALAACDRVPVPAPQALVPREPLDRGADGTLHRQRWTATAVDRGLAS